MSASKQPSKDHPRIVAQLWMGDIERKGVLPEGVTWEVGAGGVITLRAGGREQQVDSLEVAKRTEIGKGPQALGRAVFLAAFSLTNTPH